MMRIALFISCLDWVPIAKQAFEDHCRMFDSGFPEHFALDFYSPDDITQGIANIDADAIMARGVMAEMLKEMGLGVQIVEIPLGVVDLFRSLDQCKAKYKPKNVAIILSENMTYGIESLSEMIDIKISSFPLGKIKCSQHESYETRIAKHSHEAITKALASGCDAIISGHNICKYADTMNVPNTPVSYGREALWPCITEAKRLARESHGLVEKGKRFETILDRSYSGIISYDISGTITSTNSLSPLILRMEKPFTPGENIMDVPFCPSLKKVLADNSEYYNEVLCLDNVSIVYNKVGIKLNNEIVSWVVTFRDAANVKNIDQSQKKQIILKGYTAKHYFKNIIGKSPEICQCIETAKHYAKSTYNILLTGESGTGKEVFAQSIHNESARREGPFVAVNCAALPETLLESELFGYEDGAFTGAAKGGKPGYLELANNGTIFFDEIGEIPISLQAKLLRVLQEKEIIRLGGKKTVIVNVRMIFATNQNLSTQIAKGLFREDLFFRINVLPLRLPPLRSRKEDIPLLVRNFFAVNYPRAVLADDIDKRLTSYDWPGNVRQLLNICERIVALNSDNLHIDAASLDYALSLETESSRPRNLAHPTASDSEGLHERERIMEILEQCRYNKSLAARTLGWDRSTLWRKMKQHNIS